MAGNDTVILPILTEHVQRECLAKFSYVSSIVAAGPYYHTTAADFQREGKERDTFITMIREISELTSAKGYPFEKDYVYINLEILSHLDPSATTSMQRDVAAGHTSEIEGLVFDVIKRADTYSIKMPVYRKIAEALLPKEKNACRT